jgi:Family of unknown function (DUF6502)
MANRREGIGASSQNGDISTVAHALAPIAKLCMKSGMGAGELQMAAKIACIGVAAENAKLGNRLNHSRIAAVTGLTRKEVRTLSGLLKSGKVATGREVAKQRTTRVLHGWRTDPAYLDRRGSPHLLPIRGSALSFHNLVRRYGGDVTPVSVLSELVRIGAVARVGRDKVAVKKKTPRARGFSTEVFSEIAVRLRDLGTTLVDNIENPDNPLFMGFCAVENLSADEAALFHATFSERAASLVDSVNRWRASQARMRVRVRNIGTAGARVGLGVYLVNQRPGRAAQLPSRSSVGRIARGRSKD